MTTLYLNVPKDKVDGAGKKSYEDTMKSAVGSSYAIPMSQAVQCVSGSDVVLLCQATGQRTEGKRTELKPTGETTGSGMVRYDVYMEDLTPMPYRPAPSSFGRTGVLVVAT